MKSLTTGIILFLAVIISCVYSLPLHQSSLHTEVTDNNYLTFFTLGDWGWNGDDQTNVAYIMGNVSVIYPPSFIVALGDNYYNDGVKSVDDPQWKTTFQDIYTAPGVQVRWYAILGNHDHLGNVTAQVEYTKIDKRWYMPAFWYTEHFVLPDNSTLQMVFIDTVTFSESVDYVNLKNSVQNGEVPMEFLTSYENNRSSKQALIDSQLPWIEATLKNSTADWLIVNGHYPIYSGGEHGNTLILDLVLRPMLERYNVDAYFCGHDHTMQYLKDGSVHYFVSGNGAKRGTVQAIPQSVFYKVDPGFMVHQINGTQMVVYMYDLTGDMIFNVTVPRKRNL